MSERSDAAVIEGRGVRVALALGGEVTVRPLPVRFSRVWRRTLSERVEPFKDVILSVFRQEGDFDVGKLDDGLLRRLMDGVGVELWDIAADLVGLWVGFQETPGGGVFAPHPDPLPQGGEGSRGVPSVASLVFEGDGVLANATDEDVIALLVEVVRFAFPLSKVMASRGLMAATASAVDAAPEAEAVSGSS